MQLKQLKRNIALMESFSRYSRSETVQSIYCYEGTSVLKNFLNITDETVLQQYEADITSVRQVELEKKLTPTGRFSKTHLKNIHHHIFQDIYPFAGKIRQEDIWKQDTMFCKSEYIDNQLDIILEQLKQDNYLKQYTKEMTINKLAYYLAELNIIHPFREGNGRALREFIRQLALKNGYHLNWSLITRNEMINASITSSLKQYSEMESMIEKVIL